MRRRGYLQRLVLGSAALAAGALPYGIVRLLAPAAAADRRTHLRPPGALADDGDFVRACIGCGLCGEVCPPRCIRFHQRDGAGLVNTPFINPEEKACILCDKCMAVCPTEALSPMPRKDIDMGIAQIDRAACYPWVDRGVCGACVAVCPLGDAAIAFSFAGFYRPVVKKACVGCGQCVEVCPHPSLPIWIVERSQGTVARHSV